MKKMLLGLTLAAAVGPVALLPSAALGQQRYPRNVQVGGMSCMEQLGHSGKVETWCRTPDGNLTRLNDGAAASRQPSNADFRLQQPSFGSGAVSPFTKARMDADRYANGGGYFVGGMAWGFFLGPLGWLIGGLTASNSEVPLLGMDSRWSGTDQAQYMMSYTSEVRSRRTTNTVVGGIVGSLTAGLLIYAIASSGD